MYNSQPFILVENWLFQTLPFVSYYLNKVFSMEGVKIPGLSPPLFLKPLGRQFNET